MFIFRIRLLLSEDEFGSMRNNLENPEHISDDLKSHIYQQVAEQIKNVDSNYY
jgi:hypothetical protein